MQTNGELVYLDSSALVKLIQPEGETPALRAFLAERPERVSAVLVRVEVLRAVRRRGQELVAAAQAVLDGLDLITLTDDLLDAAGRLEPPELRSLDAMHIAVALEIGAEAVLFVSYDQRQTEAARYAGLRVVSPAELRDEDAL